MSIASSGGAEARSAAIAALHKLATGGDEAAGAALAASTDAMALFVAQLGRGVVATRSLRHLSSRAEALRPGAMAAAAKVRRGGVPRVPSSRGRSAVGHLRREKAALK